ncbi:Limonene 1,2-monooxygenase [Oceanobacillus oncorhynchi]|uniref:Limonene 1,2-monooxygenase n=1 Tax=Oceanobacillus oncorhynchi TaxID=545501 RepID=A0A0A1MP41_9BACI|nr:MsnO8 family LLM class oxidoreductase [Oceanobacillus oncorhynchi]CEI81407.1 Limonene 1,2-monooxygenase [Oceanobacillus oncorhynchi]
MKLSILDQSPLFADADAKQALEASMDLAVLADQLGYERYWVAEHHDMQGLASPAPDILLGIIGSRTERIRIGSGAVLLPNYRPFNIAERYRMLAALYPNRVDLGIGRAPGGSAEASIALAGNFLEKVKAMPDYIDELLHFLQDDFSPEHLYSRVTAAPVPPVQPVPWLLGTSQRSAQLAVTKKLPYVFGHFMGADNGPEIMAGYLRHAESPSAIVAVSVLCAETEKEALELAEEAKRKREEQDPSPQADQEEQAQFADKQIIGDKALVQEKLTKLQEAYQCDEIMVLTMAPTYKAREYSYRQLAEIMNQTK